MYKIGANEEQLKKLHNGIKLGLTTDEALLYAGIYPKTFNQWVKLYNFREQLASYEFKREENFIKEENETETDTENKVSVFEFSFEDGKRLYYKSEEFKNYVNTCWGIIQETKKDRLFTKMKLLDGLMNAREDRNKTYIANEYLLEHLFPEEFGNKENAPIPNEIKALKIEFVNPNNEETENRIKNIEDSLINIEERKA